MDFDMKNMTTYLGCITLALFVIYVTTNMLSLNNKVVEGLINRKQTTYSPPEQLKGLQQLKTSFEDQLHMDKYKTTYREILLNMEDIIHLAMLQQLEAAGDTKGAAGELDPKLLDSLAKLQTSKSALKDLDEFLTVHK